ncbi:MAG: DUF5696 domain-containing protein, partial [Oscillospiraceae bacterium]|nr:DUF5696 domain-containing protein [Oscillospiraceae bacterium]
LARIENGAPLAQITASVAGRLNSYNLINAVFMLRSSSIVTVSAGAGESMIPVVERRKAELDITIRYSFLTSEYAGYSGMARYERERLLAGRDAVRAGDDAVWVEDDAVRTVDDRVQDADDPLQPTDIPAFIDIIGSVTARRFFLDFAYEGQTPMTTYEQAAAIVGALASVGVERQFVNYQGWFNRGYYHDAANRLTPVRELGDVKALESLAREVESRGGMLFTDVAFQMVPFTSRHFNYTVENARYYGTGGAAAIGLWNPLSYNVDYALGGYMEMISDLLSPKFAGRYASLFMDAFGRYDLRGVSLRDLGSVLASDRKRTDVITRDEAESLVADSLRSLAAEHPLMINAANSYALPFADAVSGAPLDHGAFMIVDEGIPWYEMIISGAAPYSGSPLNLDGAVGGDQLREAALRLIEYGASPRFAFTYAPASDMKYTALNTYYSTTFDGWSDAAARVYNEVNGALSRVSGQGMILHETLSPGVKRVVYADGTEFIIDYNELTCTVREAAR